MDSLSKLAQLRVKKSKKSEEQLREEYAEQTTGPYEDLSLDDPYFEEKQKVRSKLRPFYNRLKEKQS